MGKENCFVNFVTMATGSCEFSFLVVIRMDKHMDNVSKSFNCSLIARYLVKGQMWCVCLCVALGVTCVEACVRSGVNNRMTSEHKREFLLLHCQLNFDMHKWTCFI